ncbi:MAG: hypothetical protein C0397_18370 [Odoribacter sp.]|nr:hypothetical protein [Odoribacter sp.]MDP3684398.1 DUF4279 domain-containing protein [Ignavibacteria bacterium]
MKKTEIKVEFTIYNDLILNHEEITKIIGCEPTVIWNNGDQIRKDLFRKESAWVYSTGYVDSLHVDSILDILIQMVEPIVIPLSEYIKEHDLNSKFDIVLRIAGNQPPSHCLPKRFIYLCSQLNADIDTDIYL